MAVCKLDPTLSDVGDPDVLPEEEPVPVDASVDGLPAGPILDPTAGVNDSNSDEPMSPTTPLLHFPRSVLSTKLNG